MLSILPFLSPELDGLTTTARFYSSQLYTLQVEETKLRYKTGRPIRAATTPQAVRSTS